MNKFRINLSDGAGYNGPYINKYSSNFDTIDFYVDSGISQDCTFAVVYSVCGDVGMDTEGGGLVTTSVDEESGKFVVTWTLGTEVTCDSGAVIYQVVAYSSAEDGSTKAVWYSPQGRIMVGESVDTTDYETAQIGSQPSLIAQILTKMNKVYNDTGIIDSRCTVLEAAQQQMSADIADVQAHIEQMSGQINSGMQSLEAHVAAAEQICTDLNNGMSRNSSDIAAVESRVTAAEEYCENLNSEMSANSADVALLKQQMAQAEQTAVQLSETVEKHEQSFESNEHRIQAAESIVSDLSGIVTEHTSDGVMHITQAERQNADNFFSIYSANGLLNVAEDDVAATREVLSEVAGMASDLRIAFMTGACSTRPDSYNRLKLLNSYGVCEYVFNAGGYSTDGISLSVADALEIAKAAGKGVAAVRGDSVPEKEIWSRIFSTGSSPYYYMDDSASGIRIIVLDTCSMDAVQLDWFINVALDIPSTYGAIVLSHGNLALYTNNSTGESLFGSIFQAAAESGSVAVGGSYSSPDGSVVELDEVTGSFSYPHEVIAAIHGSDGGDSSNNDLSDNFCNIGVADDMPNLDARTQTENYEIVLRQDITEKSQATSIVRAKATDVTADGAAAIQLVPLVSDAEVYITVDNIDSTDYKGYIVTQVDVKIEAEDADAGRFYIATNQSRKISDQLRISSLSNGASEDGWSRITVVTCRNPDDENYGKTNTYVNGISNSGWNVDNLGTTTDNGTFCTEVRVIANGLTVNDVIYYRQIAFYTTELQPSLDVIYNGISDGFFMYGDKFYNNSYKSELMQTLGLDKNCYDVFCISRNNCVVDAKRFGYGTSRRFKWTVPEISFE